MKVAGLRLDTVRYLDGVGLVANSGQSLCSEIVWPVVATNSLLGSLLGANFTARRPFSAMAFRKIHPRGVAQSVTAGSSPELIIKT